MLYGDQGFRGDGIASDIQLGMPWEFGLVGQVILVAFLVGEGYVGVK
jgi:hypothetical protein